MKLDRTAVCQAPKPGLPWWRRAKCGCAARAQLPGAASANSDMSEEWEKVDLPIDPTIVLLDIGFTGTDPKHGALGR